MRGIKYVVAGTPRAATGYMAELLSNLGLACNHETYFEFEQHWRSFLEPDQTLGDASWLAVPFLSEMPPTVRLLHQTRDPVSVINLLLEAQFLDSGPNGVSSRLNNRAELAEFACRYCPQVLEFTDARERAIWFYYHWNKAIDAVAEERPVLRYDIESFGSDQLRQILDHLGVPAERFSDELLKAHIEVLPRNIDIETDEQSDVSQRITWEDLPSEVRTLADSYGYGPADQAIEHAEGRNGDMASARNEVRKEAQKILSAWRGERAEVKREAEALREQAGLAQEESDRAAQRLQVIQRELADERLYRDHQPFDLRESEEARLARDCWMCRMVTEGRVLDVCCGRGVRGVLLAREGLEVIGVADDADTLAAAKKSLAAECDSVKQRVQFQKGPLLTTEFAPALFRAVILSDALTRVTQPERLLKHVVACVADGGRLVVSVPLGYHPDQDRLYTFCQMRNLLELLGRYCAVDGVEVIHDYACVTTTKPAAGASVSPPSEEDMTAWDRLGEEALAQIQRRWVRDRAILETANLKLDHSREQSQGEVARVRDELDQSQGLLEATRVEAQRCEAERDAAHRLLERAQAVQVRLAQSGANISDRLIAASTNGSGKPAQKSGGFLFFCVNGAGLGHVTRSLAIARRIRRIDPDMPIYFLSSSPALRVISREGMIAYYVPTRSEFGTQVGGNAWNKLLLEHLRTIVGMHRPAVLVYDGVSPYKGLLDSISEAEFACTAMILRLRHKHDRLLNMLDSLERFDQLVFPGEPGVEVPRELSGLNHRVFDPVVYLDPDELLPRDEVRRHWGIPEDKKAVYIQLGAGNIDDITPWVKKLLSVLERRSDVEVILAESPIASNGHAPARAVRTLTQYPNSLYFRGVDLAIAATGYNTFHELMHFGVPSIFVPNQHTVTDDQVARGMTARDHGAARVALEPSELELMIVDSLDDETARAMGENARRLVPRNGAMDIAKWLLTSASERISDAMGVAATTPCR